MAPVLTEMGGDADGPSPLGCQGGLHGIGFHIDRLRVAGVTGLPHGGDMVDVDAEQRSHAD